MSKFICSCFLFILLGTGFTETLAQEKNARIGVSVGVPNIAGLHLEYVTPLFNNRLAPMIQASLLNVTLDDVEVQLSYLEFGTNYYFSKVGKGLYANVSYGRLSSDLTFSDLDSESGSETGGTAEASVTMNRFNIKLGGKFGNGFYFRPEIGYGITSIPDDVTITASFPDGSTETQIEEIPNAVALGLSFTLGFGIAF